MSEAPFENDEGQAEDPDSQDQESEGLATGAGPTESGGDAQQNALDDVDLEPKSS